MGFIVYWGSTFQAYLLQAVLLLYTSSYIIFSLFKYCAGDKHYFLNMLIGRPPVVALGILLAVFIASIDPRTKKIVTRITDPNGEKIPKGLERYLFGMVDKMNQLKIENTREDVAIFLRDEFERDGKVIDYDCSLQLADFLMDIRKIYGS